MGETGFTAEERTAMKERARETRGARRGGGKADAEKEVLAKIAEMEDGDRALAERVHALVTAAAPQLAPKLWYGMPAYARDGKVVCFFQCSGKFKARYSTLGFNDAARLDDGALWPTAFALTADLTPDDAEFISQLVRRAAG
ncbi:DUF1801 domain-containing protein [Streptomyces longwoodensis]|uniref:iron chaperone n=1 Tax=Streptomyces longwoodensis TaxID=68231 RepID=UPI00225B4AFD|nr:DUF1801 domain-containing protein [Streptomyces longwoodensis]MCX4997601.1 DUF1801 domain-containing protein [Streptomyces longwoodensis]WUC56266.1 DUF1801 domain-containing protein [Streptomyces longwoodensis]